MTTRDTYISELRTLTTQLRTFVLLPDEMLDDEALDLAEDRNKRAAAVIDILEAVGDMSALVRAEQARHRLPGLSDVAIAPAAQKSDTLQLMEQVARHLSGRDVIVTIEQPLNWWHKGLCIFPAAPGEAVKIQINPDAVANGNSYLDVYLHEVAHAKLHTNADRDPDNAEKMEMEAFRLANMWKYYAWTHSAPMEYMPDVGGENAASNYFRLQLYTLLDSAEAAAMIL